MSALPRDAAGHMLLPMTMAQLDAVLAVEVDAYPFPWTRGNFVDSLAAGYWARVLYTADGVLLGYMVAMAGVEEMHLLNITVAAEHQRCGHAHTMHAALVAEARSRGAKRLWLEVRQSNAGARRLYETLGYREIAMRRAYYPAPQGRREDAVVMGLDLIGARDGMD
jgi:[ribosomal protein S18]-alanine N-acetyltransferase